LPHCPQIPNLQAGPNYDQILRNTPNSPGSPLPGDWPFHEVIGLGQVGHVYKRPFSNTLFKCKLGAEREERTDMMQPKARKHAAAGRLVGLRAGNGTLL
jgi:hypothetical protein